MAVEKFQKKVKNRDIKSKNPNQDFLWVKYYNIFIGILCLIILFLLIVNFLKK